MGTLLAILLGGALANNAVLAHLSGADPALRPDGRLRESLGVAIATASLLLAAAGLCWLLEHFVLMPFRIDWLRALAWLLIVVALSPLPVALLRRRNDAVATSRTLSPALLIGNGLLLGTIALAGDVDFGATLARAGGIAIGFGVVLLLFTTLRDRLDGADVPAPFRGTPILLITAALMALAFMGFAGMGAP